MMGWQRHQLNHMQAICTSLQKITMPAPHQSNFYGPDALPDTQPTASKHWRQPPPSILFTSCYYGGQPLSMSDTAFAGCITFLSPNQQCSKYWTKWKVLTLHRKITHHLILSSSWPGVAPSTMNDGYSCLYTEGKPTTGCLQIWQIEIPWVFQVFQNL